MSRLAVKPLEQVFSISPSFVAEPVCPLGGVQKRFPALGGVVPLVCGAVDLGQST